MNKRPSVENPSRDEPKKQGDQSGDGSDDFAKESLEFVDLFDVFGQELVRPSTPNGAASVTAPTIRARVLAAAAGEGRLGHFAQQISEIFLIGQEKARAILDAIDAAGAWEPGFSPEIELVHFKCGPELARADTGLIRIQPGVHWPRHRHLGREVMLILEGSIRETNGRVSGPGSVIEMDANTEHAFDVLTQVCVAAVLLEGGLEMPPGTPVIV